MRDTKAMKGPREQGRALMKQGPSTAIVVRNSDLAVVPPRPLPITFKARRSFAKASVYAGLGMICMAGGYAYHDLAVRRAVDYQYTLLFSPGVSSHTQHQTMREPAVEPLPVQARRLFEYSEKGPRADKFAYALKAAGSDVIARRLKSDPLSTSSGVQPAKADAMAGAALFMTVLNRPEGGTTVRETAPPSDHEQGEWAGLLKNASLSPSSPKTLFGGLTEDEFRSRELRCMATAIYFEARDEPIKGQVAVAQVVMNRIRSPFYPKTICGVVYQGERNRSGCQFSFSCTGKHNAIKEHDEWTTAVKLAKQVINGEVWLDDVGYATHYHATYVHPPWRHELIKITQIGGHIFYKVKPGTVQLALLSEGL